MTPGPSSAIQRLHAAFEDARDANARKDRFIAIAAHELRQPLAALMLQAESVRRTGLNRQDAFLEELGSDLRATVRRQARLVCDLVDMVLAAAGKLQVCADDVEVGSLVRRVVTAMAMAKPSVSLHMDIGPAETLTCRVDGIRVEQIISNLMDNALKFAGPAGRIDVSVIADEGFARMSVKDDGPGLEVDDIDMLFHPAGRGRGASPAPEAGMGIGLSLVRELADAQGGRVRAHSDGPGLGAEFSVWLPLSLEAHGRGVQANDDQHRLVSASGI